jgi:hypothetical protein
VFGITHALFIIDLIYVLDGGEFGEKEWDSNYVWTLMYIVFVKITMIHRDSLLAHTNLDIHFTIHIIYNWSNHYQIPVHVENWKVFVFQWEKYRPIKCWILTEFRANMGRSLRTIVLLHCIELKVTRPQS